MNKLICATLSITALLSCAGAHASDPADPFYAGVSVSTAGDLTLRRNGVSEESNRQNALKLFGGYRLSDHFSIETGYVEFGDFKYKSGPTVDLNVVYLAAKGSMPVGDHFALYGKVGVANHGQRFSDLGAVDGKYHKTKAMLGAGVEWHLSEQVSLSAELVNYGTVRTRAGVIKSRALEAGISYKF